MHIDLENVWSMLNRETNLHVSQDDATSFYHKGRKAPLHGLNGTNAS